MALSAGVPRPLAALHIVAFHLLANHVHGPYVDARTPYVLAAVIPTHVCNRYQDNKEPPFTKTCEWLISLFYNHVGNVLQDIGHVSGRRTPTRAAGSAAASGSRRTYSQEGIGGLMRWHWWSS